MKKKEAISRLHRQIDQIRKVKAIDPFGATFYKWERDTKVVLSAIYLTDRSPINSFNEIISSLKYHFDSNPINIRENEYAKDLEKVESLLESCILEIDENWPYDEHVANQSDTPPYHEVEKICSRFHLVAQQLRKRHNNRATFSVTDEYDVQDLLHALLRIFFDDIRSEEWTPSYAGKSSRMDFILKEHGIVIETKMTREGLGEKQIGEQLIVDIVRYKKHPDCKMLICFVYDPAEKIANPSGIEQDLNQTKNGLIVKVLILPKRY